jgi:hypothetical protein
VRELPPGLSTGGTLDVPVRVAGFFFKDWLYTTRGTRNDNAREVASNTPRSQFAPLFIGRGPMLLQSGRPASHISQWVLGTAFVLALAGFWATAWWFARSDRQFAAHTRGTVCSLPDGRSLNDLIVPAENEPRNVTGNDDSNTSKSPWLE